MSEEKPVESPCIKVCVLDPTQTLCIGCGRTVPEIAAWGSASEAEKSAIVAKAAARKLAL